MVLRMEMHSTRSTQWGRVQNWMRAVNSSTRPASPLCDSPKVALWMLEPPLLKVIGAS